MSRASQKTLEIIGSGGASGELRRRGATRIGSKTPANASAASAALAENAESLARCQALVRMGQGAPQRSRGRA